MKLKFPAFFFTKVSVPCLPKADKLSGNRGRIFLSSSSVPGKPALPSIDRSESAIPMNLEPADPFLFSQIMKTLAEGS